MNERWPLYPKAAKALKKMGNDLRGARRRRRISTTTLAERARISRASLYRIEKGDAGAVSGWRSIATNMGIPAAQQEEMAGVFEHAAGYNSVLRS